jgi:hypothetical protein
VSIVWCVLILNASVVNVPPISIVQLQVRFHAIATWCASGPHFFCASYYNYNFL